MAKGQDNDQVETNKELEELITKNISKAGGWISFEYFMQMAMFEPGLGYYASDRIPLGAQGDFTTAAEISPLFPRTLACFVLGAMPANGSILELGGGTGKFMANLLTELKTLGLETNCLFIETSPALQKLQQKTIAKAGFSDCCKWQTSLPKKFTGIVIAIEVLDAISCNVVTRKKDKWLVSGVKKDQESFAWQDGPQTKLNTTRLDPVKDIEGYQTEINMQAEALVASLVETVETGAILLCDYGFTQAELYHPQRTTGTLKAHYRHKVETDVLLRPGMQDLTTHVDFTSVASAGITAGAILAGYVTQQSFLLDLGITEIAQSSFADEKEGYKTSQQLQTLLMPHEMGDLFKMLAFIIGDIPEVLGFKLGDKSSWLTN